MAAADDLLLFFTLTMLVMLSLTLIAIVDTFSAEDRPVCAARSTSQSHQDVNTVVRRPAEAMRARSLTPLAHELRGRLEAGDFAGVGRIQLSDGLMVDPERMARIVLADVDRFGSVGWEWLTGREVDELQDDLLRLLALASAPRTA